MSHIEGVIRAALQDDAGLTVNARIWLPEDPPEGSAMPNGPQWLSDLVVATEEWAAATRCGVVSPPPCEHQYCRDQGYGLCFGVTGAIMDITTAGAIPVPSAPPSPTEPADIVDRIDELVNDQLANYGNRSGYDHNVNQDLCPHCGREWHGLKITARIEQMRSRGRYDEDYRYADDGSEVLCEGSDFIGPMKYGPTRGGTTQGAFGTAWINISAWFGTSRDRWWRTRIPGDFWRVTNRVDEATVQIGAQEIVVNDARVDFNNGHIDVRCTLPPGFGGTWEPISAPGVLQHPDRSRQ